MGEKHSNIIRRGRSATNGASSFNQDLSGWGTARSVLRDGMFDASGMSAENRQCFEDGLTN